jgi:hypothetical protein
MRDGKRKCVISSHIYISMIKKSNGISATPMKIPIKTVPN